MRQQTIILLLMKLSVMCMAGSETSTILEHVVSPRKAHNKTKTAICYHGQTRRATTEQLHRYHSMGMKFKVGTCRFHERNAFMSVCRNGKRTIRVRKKKLESKLAKGDTLGACVCTKEFRVCRNGQKVYRDARNLCRFQPCPCASDVKTCPGSGMTVRRQMQNGCRFASCPKMAIQTRSEIPDDLLVKSLPEPVGNCCDPAKMPGANGNPICFEGPGCCPNGEWTCAGGVRLGIGQVFPCGETELTRDDLGGVCR